VAKIPAPLALEIVRGFKGVLDIYKWKGLTCVRKWPRIPPDHRTAASLASAATFGAISSAYSLLGGALKQLFEEAAATQPRTARDLYMSATLGTLHETPMSDFLDLLTECRDSLLILQELTNALQSAPTDQLNVRGQDQLFSYKGTLASYRATLISGANGYIDSETPPAGEAWALSNIGAILSDRATTAHRYRFIRNAVSYIIEDVTAAIPAATWTRVRGDIFLEPGDVVRVWFIGGQANDSVRVDMTGYRLSLES